MRNESHTPLTEGVYYILLSLTDRLHGYGIMQFVSELSNNRVKLAPGTLYGALNNLMKKGLIESIDSPEDAKKKEYILTPLGLETLKSEHIRLKELVENGNKLLGGINND
ncbi:MAG: PadR family transcriptional regulator [Clostridium sp.]